MLVASAGFSRRTFNDEKPQLTVKSVLMHERIYIVGVIVYMVSLGVAVVQYSTYCAPFYEP